MLFLTFFYTNLYTYFGSALLNLPLPSNNKIPWGESSHKPAQVHNLFRLFLAFSYLGKEQSDPDSNNVTLYILVLVTFLILTYRIYLSLSKSTTFNPAICRIKLLSAATIWHFLLFFLTTGIKQKQEYYFYFVALFSPITCLIIFSLKEQIRKRMMGTLLNLDDSEGGSNQKVREEVLIMAFLHLVQQCNIEDFQINKQAQDQLKRIEQVHQTSCPLFFEASRKKMVKHYLTQIESLNMQPQFTNTNMTEGYSRNDNSSIHQLGNFPQFPALPSQQDTKNYSGVKSAQSAGLQAAPTLEKVGSLYQIRKSEKQEIPQVDEDDDDEDEEQKQMFSNINHITIPVYGFAGHQIRGPKNRHQHLNQITQQSSFQTQSDLIGTTFIGFQDGNGGFKMSINNSQQVIHRDALMHNSKQIQLDQSPQQYLRSIQSSQEDQIPDETNELPPKLDSQKISLGSGSDNKVLAPLHHVMRQKLSDNQLSPIQNLLSPQFVQLATYGSGSIQNPNIGGKLGTGHSFNSASHRNRHLVLSEDEIVELDAEEIDEEKQERGKEYRKLARKQVSFKNPSLKISTADPKNSTAGGQSNQHSQNSLKSKDSSAKKQRLQEGVALISTIQKAKQRFKQRVKSQKEGKIKEKVTKDETEKIMKYYKDLQGRHNKMSDFFSHSATDPTQVLSQQSTQKQQLKMKEENSGTQVLEGNQLVKLANHYFMHHLSEQMQGKVFLLRYTKIYFMYSVLKNCYLSNFELFGKGKEHSSDYQSNMQSTTEQRNESFIEVNQRLLCQRYMDYLLSEAIDRDEEQKSQRVSLGQINLSEMLSLNQLIVTFDNMLLKITDSIYDFWENLLKSQDTTTVLQQGMQVSTELVQLQEILEELQDKQSDQQSAIYLQMSHFYCKVLFKTQESLEMLEKARITIQARKFMKLREEKQSLTLTNKKGKALGLESFEPKAAEEGNSAFQHASMSSALFRDCQDKCLLVAEISTKTNMKVLFMNKKALKMSQYLYQEVARLTINDLMPRFVSQAHHLFIEEFMSTGKARVLNTIREVFLRQKSGFIVPITVYVFINNLSRKHIIMLFDENVAMRAFEEPYHELPYAFMLTTGKFDVGEVSRNFQRITGVPQEAINMLVKKSHGQLPLDDIAKVRSFNCQVKELKDLYETNEAEVTFENIRQDKKFKNLAFNAAGATQGPTNNGLLNHRSFALQQVESKQQIKMEKSSESSDSFTEDRSITHAQSFMDRQNSDSSKHNAFVRGNLMREQQIHWAETTNSQIFVMKVIEMKFLKGRVVLNLVAFRKHIPDSQFRLNKYLTDLSSTKTNTMRYQRGLKSGAVFLDDQEQFDGSEEEKKDSSSNQNLKRLNSKNKKQMILYKQSLKHNKRQTKSDDEPDSFTTSSSDETSQSDSLAQNIFKNQFGKGFPINREERKAIGIEDSSDQLSDSHSQSGVSSTFTQISNFQSQVSSNRSPKTLNILIYVIICIVLVMLIVSSVVLALGHQNLTFAEESLIVSQHSFEAYNEVSILRLLLRSLTNIALKYEEQSGSYISQRFENYQQVISVLNDELLHDSQKVQEILDSKMSKDVKDIHGTNFGITCWFLSLKGIPYFIDQTLPKGMGLISNNIQALLSEYRLQSAITETIYPFFNLQKLLIKSFSQQSTKYQINEVEKSLYFALNNSNGFITRELREFGQAHAQSQLSQSEEKLRYITGVSLAVVCLMMLSIFIIVPIFGKIQNRLFELMKLFFSIDPAVKKVILSKIYEFQQEQAQRVERLIEKTREKELPIEEINKSQETSHHSSDTEEAKKKGRGIRKSIAEGLMMHKGNKPVSTGLQLRQALGKALTRRGQRRKTEIHMPINARRISQKLLSQQKSLKSSSSSKKINRAFNLGLSGRPGAKYLEGLNKRNEIMEVDEIELEENKEGQKPNRDGSFDDDDET